MNKKTEIQNKPKKKNYPIVPGMDIHYVILGSLQGCQPNWQLCRLLLKVDLLKLEDELRGKKQRMIFKTHSMAYILIVF